MMEEESNPIKEKFFEYIAENSKTIQESIANQKFSDIIKMTIKDCYDAVVKTGNKHENIAVFATAMLHFLLTSALLTSQRKVIHKKVEIDIVIPDIKTLDEDPKKTLIIHIAKTNDKNIIKQKIKELQTVQPEKANIWLVLSENMEFENKHYTIQKDNNTFSNIIYDIAQFVNVHGENKFKILRI